MGFQSNVPAQSCLTLCNPMDCSRPGSSVHGIFFSGRNTGVSSHFLLQGVFPTQELKLGLLPGRQILHHLSYQGSSWLLLNWTKGSPAYYRQTSSTDCFSVNPCPSNITNLFFSSLSSIASKQRLKQIINLYPYFLFFHCQKCQALVILGWLVALPKFTVTWHLRMWP